MFEYLNEEVDRHESLRRATKSRYPTRECDFKSVAHFFSPAPPSFSCRLFYGRMFPRCPVPLQIIYREERRSQSIATAAYQGRIMKSNLPSRPVDWYMVPQEPGPSWVRSGLALRVQFRKQLSLVRKSCMRTELMIINSKRLGECKEK